MAEAELEIAAIAAVRDATKALNDALHVAHDVGLEIEIDAVPFQKVSDRHPGYFITGHCRKISYEINQPF